jgi:hypothetical protein
MDEGPEFYLDDDALRELLQQLGVALSTLSEEQEAAGHG